MQEMNRVIGAVLRRLRRERGWSLDTCAASTGVSKAMLGQIERGESSPTVATLWRIASGMEVPFSTFWDEGSLVERRDRVVDDETLMNATLLEPYDAATGIELLLVELAPGCERVSQPHRQGVSEYVAVVEGRLEILVEAHWHALEVGQSLRFCADRPHGYRNLSDRRASFHNIIHHPRAEG